MKVATNTPTTAAKPVAPKTLFTFSGGLADFLLAMGAVREYVRSTKAEAHIALHEDLAVLAKNAWFIKSVVDPALAVESNIVNYNHVCPLTEDVAECVAVELYERLEQKTAIDAKVAEMAVQMDVPVDRIQLPPEYALLGSTEPTWGKLHGYAYNIQKVTGSKFNLTDDTPYFPALPGIMEKTRKYLHDNRGYIKAGAPFTIIQNLDYFETNGAELIYPGAWGCIIAEDVPLDILVGLVSHTLCTCVMGPVADGLTYLGWAASTPLTLEFIDGTLPAHWILSRHKNVLAFDMSNPDVASNLTANLRAVYRVKLGLDVV